MQRIRQLHLWLGVFFAPMIIFFAFSGALQTFNLHETRKGGSYHAPAWIARLAAVHKDQRLSEGRHAPSSMPFKWLVAAMSVGLIFTSGLGIYMGFKFHKDRRVIWALLALGVALPVLFLFIH